ncbi:hypothetical protein TNCV_4510631 [Trichonephila clavipes]|nr:hypothetical protein TNCV_4510631 [Trichonephila clavipes]
MNSFGRHGGQMIKSEWHLTAAGEGSVEVSYLSSESFPPDQNAKSLSVSAGFERVHNISEVGYCERLGFIKRF